MSLLETLQLFPTANAQFYSLAEYIAKFGKDYLPQACPKKHKAGLPQMCFQNARNLASRHHLTYVEGFALPDFANIPIFHAWCVDEKGHVIDNTWSKQGKAYRGVAFALDFVRAQLKNTNCMSVLDNWQNGFPLLRKI
jgi:hypothetical protein